MTATSPSQAAAQQHQASIPRIINPQQPARPQQLHRDQSHCALSSPQGTISQQRRKQQTAAVTDPGASRACKNCGTTKTPLWRPFDGVQLCNACGELISLKLTPRAVRTDLVENGHLYFPDRLHVAT